MSCLIGYELVTQIYEAPNSNADDFVDLSIPNGMNITGSGILITHRWNSNTDTWDEVTEGSTSTESTVSDRKFNNGPHPTDNTKWRFQLTGTGGSRGKFLLWIACVG